MTDHEMKGFVLDARPDRIDFRDRVYQPPLVSLPDRSPSDKIISGYLPLYHEHGMILDQGSEGACTGFGLAAVINYVTWERWMYANNGEPGPDVSPPPHVSPWMLYDNARVYDEWEGEDYSGSSCRGAMKGWHKHGVCEKELWPAPPQSKAKAKRRKRRKRPLDAWRSDAAGRPLGAYYRVDARSLADMQAAICEVRAVYCSARVHKGWLLDGRPRLVKITDKVRLPVIDFDDKVTGGHAFALVGYTEHGFIVQNSWGEGWGWKGFALLTYEDWVQHGDDAWVAAMSARTHVAAGGEISTSRSETPMQVMRPTMAGKAEQAKKEKKHQPWTEDEAYQHAVVMGNDGKLLRRLIETADAEDNLQKVVFENTLAALEDGKKHVMLYAHGGLNSERAAVERIMRMGPWFEANDIHPIFIVWRTSLLESIGQIGQDFVEDFRDQRDELRSEGIGDIFDKALKKLQNKFDKAFEVAAEKVIGKPVWSQMKQNADAASKNAGGAKALVDQLRKLKTKHPDFALHLAGHSAGSIMLGHMLEDFGKHAGIDTVSLYAPACSIDFAIRHYGRAHDKGVIGKGKLHVDNLSDRNERDDTVGPYGKSLLYLVSRAFEDPHKTPLLGLDRCWVEPSLDEEKVKELLGRDFADDKLNGVVKWAGLADTFDIKHPSIEEREVEIFRDKTDRVQIKAVHGSFDNALAVVNANVARMLGTKKPKVEITDLRGF